MAITVLIDAIDRTSLVRFPSISLTQELHTRSLATLQLVSESPTEAFFRPNIGEPLLIKVDGTTIFAGTIDRLSEHREKALGKVLYIDVECVSWEQILDRHLIADSYENQTLAQIVNDIRTTDLDGEGLTDADIQTGPTIEKAVFNYQSATEVFNELAQLTGYEWWIDVDKGIHFVQNGTSMAPIDLDGTDKFEELTIVQERSDYRNVQYIKAGKDVTDEQVDSFLGDTENRTFTLKFPVASVTSITVNMVAKTFGVRGVEGEGSKNFYYQVDDPRITQDTNDTELSGSDTLEITYRGFIPLLIIAREQSEIDDRQAIEGGSGIYENVEDRQEINAATFAYDLANGILRRKGLIPIVLEFETTELGLRAGQLLTVNLPAHGLSGDYLISRVEFSMIGTLDHAFRYRIEAMTGEALGGWAEFWMKLAKQGRKFTHRENEVVTPVIYNQEEMEVTETFSATEVADPCAYVDVSEIGLSQICA